MKKEYDAIIIGGGFYGLMIALHLSKKNQKVLVLEKNDDVLKQASYNNQARIHNGYHYPRSYITALRSHQNYENFLKDFSESVYSSHTKYYAIAKDRSKVTSNQFFNFCCQIGAPIKEINKGIIGIFNDHLIDSVFEVEEKIFNAAKLRDILIKKINYTNIELVLNTNVLSVFEVHNYIGVICTNNVKYYADHVYNASYSGINEILESSDLPLIPFKFEYVEMPLIAVPKVLKNIALTIMDGPFFGFLPFPDKNSHSLYHVRYAVHDTWLHTEKMNIMKSAPSRYKFMIKDAQRFVPELAKAKYIESLFEIRTILQKDEFSDGRPILYKKDYFIKNFNIVMGGKIDNIYDILEKID